MGKKEFSTPSFPRCDTSPLRSVRVPTPTLGKIARRDRTPSLSGDVRHSSSLRQATPPPPTPLLATGNPPRLTPLIARGRFALFVTNNNPSRDGVGDTFLRPPHPHNTVHSNHRLPDTRTLFCPTWRTETAQASLLAVALLGELLRRTVHRPPLPPTLPSFPPRHTDTTPAPSSRHHRSSSSPGQKGA